MGRLAQVEAERRHGLDRERMLREISSSPPPGRVVPTTPFSSSADELEEASGVSQRESDDDGEQAQHADPTEETEYDFKKRLHLLGGRSRPPRWSRRRQVSRRLFYAVQAVNRDGTAAGSGRCGSRKPHATRAVLPPHAPASSSPRSPCSQKLASSPALGTYSSTWPLRDGPNPTTGGSRWSSQLTAGGRGS
jgi:hypothetical protein